MQPHGPWLDYVAAGLPEGIDYKRGRDDYYLNYAVNKGRKRPAQLQLARLPGLRVLSLDLGHRYGAACAVWETLTREEMIEACREADNQPKLTGEELYVHLRRHTEKIQKSGRNKGERVVETTVYRRIGPDVLPDGSKHPAPWARLERQFLIKLQGEDRPARRALETEIERVNEFRHFLGLAPLDETARIDDLHGETVKTTRLGLRRLSDAARIAYTMTAVRKPTSGGREEELGPEQRIEYVQDALAAWQELATSKRYQDAWARRVWETWVEGKLHGPEPVEIGEDVSRSERKKRREQGRAAVREAAEQLADPQCAAAKELHRLWSEEWERRERQWRDQLRWLRRFVLPRKEDWKRDPTSIRYVGGLSTRRLRTIRDLYQVLKAFRMRAEPHDLRANMPEAGDDRLANFGRRILNQLEQLREQRIKQLASRVIEAALGAGRMNKVLGRDRKRPQERVDRTCHAVVVEDLEFYRPEDSRLRRENRQLMDWAARNVRKYIMEGCQLHGLHFVEAAARYTSKQDSRTGAPGVRCEDIPRAVLQEAARRVCSSGEASGSTDEPRAAARFERQVRYWVRELSRLRGRRGSELSPRDQILLAIIDRIGQLPQSRSVVRLPRPGAELFVSTDTNSPAAGGIQADLNAAANIGLKALTDPDWDGAWWFVLGDPATGKLVSDKIQGCLVWGTPQVDVLGDETPKTGNQRKRSQVYLWNPRFWSEDSTTKWRTTRDYWNEVERVVGERLREEQTEVENPF